MSGLVDELEAQRIADQKRLLDGYIAYLFRGCTTHATYAALCSQQAVELSKRVETMSGNMQVAAEDEETVDGSPIELASLREEILNLEASVNSLGLSICLVGLAVLAGQGHPVPQAPQLPEVPE